MNDAQHIALLEETAATLRRMRTDEVFFLNGTLEIIESTDGETFVVHQRGAAFVGKFLRVQMARSLLTQETVPPGAKIRRVGLNGLVRDVHHYPLLTIYPGGVSIPGPNIQTSFTVVFLTWRQLADEWEIYACPPWDFWQPCYLSPAPVEQTALEEIAAQGVGPRRVNLEDAPASPADNSDVPF